MLPGVKSVSPQSGSHKGQFLTISGSGFSTKASEVSVTVDGTICDLEQATITQVMCYLRAKGNETARLETNSSSPQMQYLSGTGLRYQRYSIGNINVWSFRNAYKSSSLSLV